MAKRKSKNKRAVKYIIAIFVLAIIVLGAYFVWKYLPIKQKNVLAVVNGEEITSAELDQKYARLPEQYKLVITKELLLDQLINTRLLVQEATEKGITLTEKEINAEIDKVKKQFDTEDDFNKFLKDTKMTMDEVTHQITEQLMISKLLDQEILSKIEITESKMKNFYDQNKEDLNVSYYKIKDQINQTLYQDSSSSAINTYIEQLKSKSKITIFGKEEAEKNTEVKEETETPSAEEPEEKGTETPKTEEPGEKLTELSTFTETTDDICTKDDKPIIRLYTVSKCDICDTVEESIGMLSKEYGDKIIAYSWELDTGDNLLSEETEKGIPKSEIELFKKYNEKATVPTLVFGCKYIRVGKSEANDAAEFKAAVEKLLE